MTKYPQIIKKEVLPCRCIRYVYERGIDVLYCKLHTKMIEGKEERPDVQLLIHTLYTEPPFVPKKQSKVWRAIRKPLYITATVLLVVSPIGYLIWQRPITPPRTKINTSPTVNRPRDTNQFTDLRRLLAPDPSDPYNKLGLLKDPSNNYSQPSY
jgi:hypothetical protein